MSQVKPKPRAGATHLAVCLMIEALQLDPHTIGELVALTGCAPTTVEAWVSSFMNPRRKLIHISLWAKRERRTFAHVTRYHVPAYSWGNLPDAPEPAKESK